MGLRKERQEAMNRSGPAWFIKLQSWKRVPRRPCREPAFDFPSIINCCPVQIKSYYLSMPTNSHCCLQARSSFSLSSNLNPFHGSCLLWSHSAWPEEKKKKQQRRISSEVFPDASVRLWPWNLGGAAAERDKSSRQYEIMRFLSLPPCRDDTLSLRVDLHFRIKMFWRLMRFGAGWVTRAAFAC